MFSKLHFSSRCVQKKVLTNLCVHTTLDAYLTHQRTKMSNKTQKEIIVSFINEIGLPYEVLPQDNSWALQPRTEITTRIAISINENVVLFSTPVLDLGTIGGNQGELFRTMLRLNARQLHAAYTLVSDNHVTLEGSLESENLDYNEFQGMIDDICLGIQTDFNSLRNWS